MHCALDCFTATARIRREKHIVLARQKPQFIDLRKLFTNHVGDMDGEPVIPSLYLIEVLTTRKPDMPGKSVC